MMKRSLQRKLVRTAAGLSILAAAAIGARQLYIRRPAYGLPYSARFMPDADDRWTALGGTWEVIHGAMRNDSNDRGAKLLTGSPHWENYIVEGDTQLLGVGSVGLLARVSEAELGENSFKGYFAGVRTVDNSLVLGAYDFAYHEAAKVTLPDLVRPFRWYHLKLRVDGCQITAFAWAAGMGEVRTEPVNDPDCFRSGTIGLRSNGTGGVWGNVKVLPVNSSARAADTAVSNPKSAVASSSRAALPPTLKGRKAAQLPGEGVLSAPPQTISSLQYVAPFGAPAATVRGSVVLTRPALYVQDATGGGVEVQSASDVPLKIGDEVEVTGEVSLDKFSPVIRKARIHLVREDVPVFPMVLTVNQVATGSYDGRFVQVEGRLVSISAGNEGALTMFIDAGTQSFHALLPAGRSRSHLQHLAVESRLRIRGVSVVDARFNNTADPFVILVRSAEDVEVVAGPPWWRPSNLIFAALVGLGLIFACNHFYLRIKHWRLRTITEERERLAHEIHDTLAQSFAGIGFQLQAIRNSMPPDAPALERQVDLAMLMTRTSHEEARRSIASMRPRSLGPTGLLPALRECAERMVRNGNVAVETQGDPGGRNVPPRIKDALYGIGQEAIANSIRHAGPGTIRIGLERHNASICLWVEDDGRGFMAESDCAGFGLQGMRRKAQSISATLAIRSSPGAGTRVEVKAPVGSRFRIVAPLDRGFTG